MKILFSKFKSAGYILGIILFTFTQLQAQEKNMNYNKLNAEEKRVIINKGTERPFTGKYNNFKETGTYICKRCNSPLYGSNDKFNSSCGWPSFDDEIPGTVKHVPDADGSRTEIICNNCNAHLGHVFAGEGFTDKNIRHCVNSISLNFIPAGEQPGTKKAYFAGGCFWGVEYYFQQEKGVLSVKSGYMGGNKQNPTYKEVCSGNTGHAEVVEVEYDNGIVKFEKLARLFFEIHDPEQINRQGPDIGSQYRSVIFYADKEQKETAEDLIKKLEDKGFKVATQLTGAGTFWEAGDYHQDYYDKTGKSPYCHFYTKRF